MKGYVRDNLLKTTRELTEGKKENSWLTLENICKSAKSIVISQKKVTCNPEGKDCAFIHMGSHVYFVNSPLFIEAVKRNLVDIDKNEVHWSQIIEVLDENDKIVDYNR